MVTVSRNMGLSLATFFDVFQLSDADLVELQYITSFKIYSQQLRPTLE